MSNLSTTDLVDLVVVVIVVLVVARAVTRGSGLLGAAAAAVPYPHHAVEQVQSLVEARRGPRSS